MSDYFIYYSSINLVGFIIFGIMLAHDRIGIDRQEKQLKYDRTLMAFMAYFLTDSVWCAVDSELLPNNTVTVLLTSFANYVVMTAITYTWLQYVMALEQLPKRNKPISQVAIITPFLVSVAVLIVTYFVAPGALIDEQLKTKPAFDVFLVCVPYIYIVAVIIYVAKKAMKEENAKEKRKHLYVGLIPVVTVIGGLMQMILMPELPIFCFSATILMLGFYIQSMDGQISTDPLTKLNNRGQLERYVSQSSNLRMEGRKTFVVMMDVNDFKKINDTYGHAEGDAALVIVAQSLVNVVKRHNFPLFLGRYGGDEFVLIIHTLDNEELESVVGEIRESVGEKCKEDEKPYVISMGIGFDELLGVQDTIQKCMQRADGKLYLDKEYCKLNGKSTILN